MKFSDIQAPYNRWSQDTGPTLEPIKRARARYLRLGVFEPSDRESSAEFLVAYRDPACQAKNEEYAEIGQDRLGNRQHVFNIV